MGVLSSSSVEAFIVSSGRSILPFGTRTSKPIESKIMGTRRTCFASGVLESEYLFFFFFFFFFLWHSQHVEVLRPGIECIPQQ